MWSENIWWPVFKWPQMIGLLMVFGSRALTDLLMSMYCLSDGDDGILIIRHYNLTIASMTVILMSYWCWWWWYSDIGPLTLLVFVKKCCDWHLFWRLIRQCVSWLDWRHWWYWPWCWRDSTRRNVRKRRRRAVVKRNLDPLLMLNVVLLMKVFNVIQCRWRDCRQYRAMPSWKTILTDRLMTYSGGWWSGQWSSGDIRLKAEVTWW
jgi:hypothetical protein